MTQLTIDLPQSLQGWVESRLAFGEYVDAAEYVRDLVRRDRERMEAVDPDEIEEMRALFEEGIASGICDEKPEEVLRRVIADTSRRHG